MHGANDTVVPLDVVEEWVTRNRNNRILAPNAAPIELHIVPDDHELVRDAVPLIHAQIEALFHLRK